MTITTSEWSGDFYSQDQLGKLAEVTRELHRTGNPGKAIKIELQMEEQVPFSELELPDEASPQRHRGALRPETRIEPSLVDEPPRKGKGSGHKAWAEFASLVSTMETEVIDQFNRDELIGILVDRDIIDPSE